MHRLIIDAVWGFKPVNTFSERSKEFAFFSSGFNI